MRVGVGKAALGFAWAVVAGSTERDGSQCWNLEIG